MYILAPREERWRAVRAAVSAALLTGVMIGLPATPGAQAAGPIVIGALYPLHLGSPPVEEYHGLQTAVTMIDAAGGVHGRTVQISFTPVNKREDAPAAVQRLVDRHVTAIVGSSESTIAVTVSVAAQDAGAIYWESGAAPTRL